MSRGESREGERAVSDDVVGGAAASRLSTYLERVEYALTAAVVSLEDRLEAAALRRRHVEGPQEVLGHFRSRDANVGLQSEHARW